MGVVVQGVVERNYLLMDVADDVNTAVKERIPENDGLIWNLSHKSNTATKRCPTEISLLENLTC
jgi:hypothetical protein